MIDKSIEFYDGGYLNYVIISIDKSFIRLQNQTLNHS